MSPIKLSDNSAIRNRMTILSTGSTEVKGANAVRGSIERAHAHKPETGNALDQWDDWLDGGDHSDSDGDDDD